MSPSRVFSTITRGVDPITALPPQIQPMIYEKLSMPESLTAMAVSSSLRHAVTNSIIGRFHRLLSSKGLQPHATRNIMRHTGAVITGDCALDFTLGDLDAPATLEFVVTDGAADDFLDFLNGQGFHIHETVKWWNDLKLDLRGVEKIVTVSSGVGPQSGNDRASTPQMVQVVVSRDDKIATTLANGRSTAAMTFLTADALHVQYPHLTFNRRAVLTRRVTDPVPFPTTVGELANLPPPTKEHIFALKARSFDVRPSFAWDNAVCGTACGVYQTRFTDGTAFELRFSPSLANHEPSHAKGWAGPDSPFRLSGVCHNEACPNKGQKAI